MTDRPSRWRFDIWSDDDPAVRRVREAIASSPAMAADAPQTAQDAPQRPERVEVAADTAPEYHEPPEAVRRGRVSELVQRVRDGDLGAIAALREILDRK